jgi:hypothetical protein
MARDGVKFVLASSIRGTDSFIRENGDCYELCDDRLSTRGEVVTVWLTEQCKLFFVDHRTIMTRRCLDVYTNSYWYLSYWINMLFCRLVIILHYISFFLFLFTDSFHACFFGPEINKPNFISNNLRTLRVLWTIIACFHSHCLILNFILNFKNLIVSCNIMQYCYYYHTFMKQMLYSHV